MIIIKISGGLGNQLFQYSFGRALSKKLNTNLKFDFQLNYSQSSFTQRENGLSKFNFSFEEASAGEIKMMKKFNHGILYRIERKLAQKFPFLFKKQVIESTGSLISNKILNNAYYDGYWQSEQYFKPIGEDLFKEFTLKINLQDDALLVLKNILESNSVSIHVRRGDYLNISINQSIFCTCSLEYYQKAIALIKQNTPMAKFFVFSDDIDWVKEHFIDENFTIVDVKDKAAEIDFWLMANCKHQIIANSSYSWWAAWLNKNENKIVIAPSNWYKDPKKNDQAIKNLIPQNWIKA